MKHRPATWNPLRAPVNVTWEITANCNLKCRHCLSAGPEAAHSPELTFDQCCTLIDELSRMDVFQINFGGGEPFLREDFLAVLDYAHAQGIVTCVSTNGTVLNSALAARLAGMDLLRIQVSLDGATAETNDAIRGEGTYHQILEAIALLREHNFPGLSINTVVTRTNYGEIEALCGLASHYGAKTRLSRFRPSGSAQRVWAEYRLHSGQLAGLSEFLGAHREVLTGDSFFSIADRDRRDMGLNACGAARLTCGILPDGSVYPCAFLTDTAFRGGSILEEPLEQIWHKAPAFDRLRSVRVEACETCPRFSLCNGGCPAVAYFLFHSLNCADPECTASFRGEVSAHAGTI